MDEGNAEVPGVDAVEEAERRLKIDELITHLLGSTDIISDVSRANYSHVMEVLREGANNDLAHELYSGMVDGVGDRMDKLPDGTLRAELIFEAVARYIAHAAAYCGVGVNPGQLAMITDFISNRVGVLMPQFAADLAEELANEDAQDAAAAAERIADIDAGTPTVPLEAVKAEITE